MPPDGTVHLWFIDLAAMGSPLMLSDDDHRNTPLRPRHERTIRRFYLRLLLGAYLGISGKDVRISRMVKGKPVLDPEVHHHPLDFSSAGSNGCCLIGICGSGQIGVDLEESGRLAGQPMALVRRYFSRSERGRFAEMDDAVVDRAFLHTWACKEAVVKAAGHGIANQLCRFTVNTDPAQPASVLDIEDDSVDAWRLAMVSPSDGFIGSVALRNEEPGSDDLRIKGFLLSPRPGTSPALEPGA